MLTKSASIGSRQLFTLAILALNIAFGAIELFDVSFALGAFFAGVVLNESELSYSAPFMTTCRCAAAFAVFFSRGMLFAFTIFLLEPLTVLATLAIILL